MKARKVIAVLAFMVSGSALAQVGGYVSIAGGNSRGYASISVAVPVVSTYSSYSSNTVMVAGNGYYAQQQYAPAYYNSAEANPCARCVNPHYIKPEHTAAAYEAHYNQVAPRTTYIYGR